MLRKEELASGLNVITYNMPYLASVAINLIIKVGSRYEKIEENGISHFLEHMAFKGTTTRSAKNIAEHFDAIGGNFNAYTSLEYTVYHTKVMQDNVSEAIEILADVIQNSKFAESDIENECKVISQEIASDNDSPFDIAYNALYAKAYSNQPMGRSILGTKDNIKNFKKQDFKAYLSKYYIANNMYLSLAGNVDHEVGVDLINTSFSKLKTNNIIKPVGASYVGGYQFIQKQELDQTILLLSFASIPYLNTKQFYTAQILSLIFGDGASSRLFQRIREELGLVYSVNSHNSSYIDTGLFTISAGTSEDKITELLDVLIQEIDKIKQCISIQELVRAKNQIKAGIFMASERSSYKSEYIAKSFATVDKYISPDQTVEQIMAINITDIIEVAVKIFSSKPTLCLVGNYKTMPDYYQICQSLK